MMDLTVAICMYNAEKYIEETLDSLMKQTRQDFKLLIVNDCSTDNSVEIVKRYFQKHSRPYDIHHQPENQGLCAGRRWVEENVTTKYLLFVDADDCPEPNLVEELYEKITSDDDLMAVGCHLEYIGSNGEKLTGGIFLGETSKEDFYQKAKNEKLIFMQPTAIYNREIALRVGGHHIDGFPEGKPRYRDLCEDLDLWTRMSDLYVERKAIVVVPKVLCRYRKHESALSANSIGMILRMRQIKTNLKRRRRGEKELTFIKFREQMSAEEYRNIEREAKAADLLRSGYYRLRKGKILSGVADVVKSTMLNPQYMWSKVKHNLLRLK